MRSRTTPPKTSRLSARALTRCSATFLQTEGLLWPLNARCTVLQHPLLAPEAFLLGKTEPAPGGTTRFGARAGHCSRKKGGFRHRNEKRVGQHNGGAHRHSYRFLLAHRRNKHLCRSSLCHRGNGCHCAFGLWVCALARASYLELLGRNRTSHRSLAARVNAGRDSSHGTNLDSLACAGRRTILDRRVDRRNQTHSRRT